MSDLREDLAHNMFHRQAADFGAEPAVAELMWATGDGVRQFWLGEAEAVLAFLAMRQALRITPGSWPVRTPA